MPTVETQAATLNLSTLAYLLYTRRRFILAVSVSTAILLFCISLLLKNTYKATVLVMPPDHSSSSALSMMAATGSGSIPSGALSMLNVKNPTDLYVALMLSPVVEDAVIARFDLKKQLHQNIQSVVRKALEARTEIVPDNKSGIISVSVVDSSPEQAAAIANDLVKEFEAFSAHLAITDAARRRLFFEQQVAQTTGNLTRAEDALQLASARSGNLEPQGTVHAMIGYEMQLREQIAAQSVELDSMKMSLAETNPEVQTKERALQTLRQQASALAQKTGGGFSNGSATESSLEYQRKLRQVRTQEALYELLFKNLEGAKLDEAREGNVVQIVDPATPPDLKNGPHRTFFLVGGFLLGFIASMLWVVTRWATQRIAA